MAATAPTYLPLFLLLLSPLTASSSSPVAAAEPEQPQDLLLRFKASLLDPSNALSSWSNSTPYCNWPHVTCTDEAGAGAGATAVSVSLEGLGLSGDIDTAALCRVPGLAALSLASNAFNQSIPLQLSRCASLVSLNLSSAAFWGPIPDQIAMLAALTSLDLSGNDIEGQVPPGLAALRGLEVLDLGGNRLSGVLHPALFGNLTRLRFLDLSKNQFLESELPPELGEMASLRWLFLQGSGFTGAIPRAFLALEQLEALDLSMNSLTGALPPGFGLNFRKLLSLDLSRNGFSGPFPKEIEECVMLQRFEVHGNAFAGELPAGLWSLPDLRVIRAENNQFAGRLPELPGGSRLEQVQVDNNSFSGEIPQSVGLIHTMYRFSASMNRLNGSLPDNLCDSPAMSIINVSHNSLSGSIPEFKNCKRLVSLYLSGNTLTGPIPASLGGLPVLTYIDLSSNGLTGGIPAELQNLKLALLNVSYNQLSGRVPPGLASGLPALFLQGNPGLCGPGLPNDCGAPLAKHQRLALAATVASFVAGAMLLAIGAFAVCRRLHGSKLISPWKLVLFYPIKVTGEELFAAFHDKNVIGRGALGNSYLIELRDGQNVVAKRLVRSGKLTFREAKNEMKVLAKIRHRNIAKMLGFCYSEGEVSIICEYFQRGSLRDMIRAPKFALGWNDRLRIALGVAQGLVFLHHDYNPCVLHRDLKSSNVLLGDELEPRVTGFGVDRIVGEKAFQSSLASGLNHKCYIAPEQNCSKNPTNLMDIYSFGVILLELITGKPGEQPASENSMDIVKWVRRRINVINGALQIIDPSISDTAQQGMQLALELAVRCTSVMPDQRPSMDEVVRSLQALCFSAPPQAADAILH